MECHDGIMGNGIMGARDQTMMSDAADAMRCDAMRANSNRQLLFFSHQNKQATPESSGKPYY
jgi:hypothetical protein